jgi:DNA-binding transcriptional LysR family regulator
MVTSHDVDLPALLATFHDDHPAVEITLTEGNSDELADGIRSGRFDAAIISLGSGTPPGLDVRVITEQGIIAAVSHDHELAVHKSISLDILRGLPLISLPRGTGLRAHLDDACAVAGFTPKVAFEASDPSVLAQLAKRGLGVAILPEEFAVARADWLRPIAFHHPRLRGRLALAWRSGGPAGPAGRALVDRARRMLDSRS